MSGSMNEQTRQLCVFENGRGLDWGVCVSAGGRGVGDGESAMLCLACSWGPSGVSASLYHSYIMLHLCANLVTPNLGISMFSLQLDCKDYMPLEKILQPLGFWGSFKINSITLYKHACEARNKVFFFTEAPENVTFWKYMVFTWQQQ